MLIRLATILFALTTSITSFANDFANNFSWQNATIYFTYVDRFFNGDTSNDNNYGRITDYGNELQNVATFHGGDIAGLTQKLKQGYFKDLGVNVIWVTGVYEQMHGWVGGGDKNDFPHYGYHGYYPLDFTALDKNFGTAEEFRQFVNLAHKQGIRVIMDAGINHPGYHTLLDAVQYKFGGVALSEKQAAEHIAGLNEGKQAHYEKYAYLQHFNKSHHSDWSNWWGKDWIRSASEIDKDVLTESIFGLADFKTEQQSNVNLPPLMVNKWQQEDASFDPWVVPAAKKYRKNMPISQTDYVILWLSAWVEEFGIDGFRLDVLDNVDTFRWQQLHQEMNKALAKWRTKNKDLVEAKWQDDFWLTGDIWGAGINVYPKYQAAGLDTIVNFTFPKTGNLKEIGKVWQQYADEFNNTPNWSTVSFLNNTYKRDTDDDNMMAAGTSLLLAPGAVQIFYGDEVARKRTVQYASDKSHGYRSSMQWQQQDKAVLAHWQKLGQFRQHHLAVGAGQQQTIAANTFVRTFNSDTTNDWVLIKITDEKQTKVNVSKWAENGETLRNAYTGEVQKVIQGTVSFKVENKLLLLEKVNG